MRYGPITKIRAQGSRVENKQHHGAEKAATLGVSYWSANADQSQAFNAQLFQIEHRSA